MPLCHLPALLASCSLAQRTKHWNASSLFPSANAVPRHLNFEVFLISLQWAWMHVSPCNVCIPQSFLQPLPSELLCFQMSDSLVLPLGLSSSFAAASVILSFLSLATVCYFVLGPCYPCFTGSLTVSAVCFISLCATSSAAFSWRRFSLLA